MKIFFLIFLSCLIFNKAQSIETKIIHRIQNEIITNIDIKNQFKYLVAINNTLKELTKEKILNISNESIIREKVKKIEISKNFEELKIEQEYLNTLLKSTYSRLGLKSLDEFILYLKDYDLNIKDIEKKMTIDALWNELILKKYTSQISINEELIKKEILKNEKKQSKEYELSEIIFDVKNKNEIQKKYKEVLKSINEIGFKNSASIYSVSDSAKIGGSIGWINENSLNKKIRENISYLKVGDVSKPIVLSNGILILKLVNTKSLQINIDVKSEFKKAVIYERNRQLNQYSQIYYNKVKKNLEFDG
jgi:peptidyl-prolyl cis-trans isomerase SurA|tara:strand:- start:2338 stop:3255 length:918 start_codon:yes stop_codon:yes gene_type:complete